MSFELERSLEIGNRWGDNYGFNGLKSFYVLSFFLSLYVESGIETYGTRTHECLGACSLALMA